MKRRILLYLLVCLSYTNMSFGQGSDLGAIWTKDYNFIGRGKLAGLEPQSLYYNATNKSLYLLTGSLTPRSGFIAIMNEAGEISKIHNIPIPSYYDRYSVRPATGNGAASATTDFKKVYDEYYINDEAIPADVLSCCIITAVMKPDGSILAFGHVRRYNAPAWTEGAGPQDADPATGSAERMKTGIWKITISADGNTVTSDIARGSDANRMLVYNDKILLSGIDWHEPTAGPGNGVGMLHEYDLNGNFVAERCPPAEDDKVYLHSKQSYNGDIVMNGWGTPSILLDGSTYTVNSYVDPSVLIPGADLTLVSGRGTMDGGAYFSSQFSSNPWFPAGIAFYKVDMLGTLKYTVLNDALSRDLMYEPPIILNPSTKEYVGTAVVTTMGIKANKIYKIKDDGTSGTVTMGENYPRNTVLEAVSLENGFFSITTADDPSTPLKRLGVISKLSDCVNFQATNDTANIYIPWASNVNLVRNIGFKGSKGSGIKYTLKAEVSEGSVDGKTAGQQLFKQDGTGGGGGNATGTVYNMNISHTINSSNRATIKYTLDLYDQFTIGSTPQSCGHTYVFYTYINNPTSSLFSDDIWFFGNNEGQVTEGSVEKGVPRTSKGIRFDNINGVMVPRDYSRLSKVNSWENSLSVSTPSCNGSFIFYTSHDTIYNSNHDPMKSDFGVNGHFMGHQSTCDGLAACYIGDNKYVLASINYDLTTNNPPRNKHALLYYIVDMNEDGGNGKIFQGGVIEAEGLAEAIEIVPKTNTSDEYWILYYHMPSNQVRVASITKNGVTNRTDLAVSLAAYNTVQDFGLSIIANKSYTQIALAFLIDVGNDLILFDFDPLNGNLSVNRAYPAALTPINSQKLASLVFSESGKYLYGFTGGHMTQNGEIRQYDLSSPLTTFKKKIYKSNVTTTMYEGAGSKMGPDGRIYTVLQKDKRMIVFSNPEVDFSLPNAYDTTSLKLRVESLGMGTRVSTGLTRPWLDPEILNEAPVANTDAVLVYEGLPVTIKPLDNDYDPDGTTGTVADLHITQVEHLNMLDKTKIKVDLNVSTEEVSFSFENNYKPLTDTVIKFQYILKDKATPVPFCDEGAIVFLIKKLELGLIDSCSFEPKLTTRLSVPQYTAIWEKAKVDSPSDTNPAHWDIVTGQSENKLPLNNLADGTYNYRYRMKDVSGNESYSSKPIKIKVSTHKISKKIWYKVEKL